MQLTSWLLVSFCNIKLLFWRYWCRHMTKLFWLRTKYLSELLHCLVAKLACGPTIVWSKPRASSGFTYRAVSCQAHRPQGWSVNGKDDYTMMASARSNRQQWLDSLDSLSHSELPAAVLFKELTWHWCNVWLSTTCTAFDLSDKKCRLGEGLLAWKDEKHGRSSRWSSRCLTLPSLASPLCVKHVRQETKRRQGVEQEGAEFQDGQTPQSFCLRVQDLAINSQANVGWVEGEVEFWLLMPGSLAFTRGGVEN